MISNCIETKEGLKNKKAPFNKLQGINKKFWKKKRNHYLDLKCIHYKGDVFRIYIEIIL